MTQKTPTLIVGAGAAARFLIREMCATNGEYKPVCIVDDNPYKVGRLLNDIPVTGKTEDIQRECGKNNIEVIFIAIPSLSSEDKRRILDYCTATCCKVYSLPDIQKLNTETAMLTQAADIDITDFLNRDPVILDSEGIEKSIAGKVVLVTGGGGSIGSELCRQIAAYNPGKLVVVDFNENNCFEIENEIIIKYGRAFPLMVEIASVRDYNKLNMIFDRYKPNVVIHAAAHKHVPYMQHNPEEAVKNNVLGTYQTTKLASEYNCERFILISTDKAVNTTNIMGATKRCCEIIIQYFSSVSPKTIFSAVRFGNVLGSAGSVIPLFKKQLAMGGPITITDTEITRYFMTIPEAASLILQSAAFASTGDIYILDMGEPVKIIDLAEKMIKLSGKTNIEIKTVGLRQGEKLHEELYFDKNSIMTTQNKKIFIEHQMNLEYNSLVEQIHALINCASQNDQNEIKRLLSEVIGSTQRAPVSSGAQAQEEKIFISGLERV